MRRALVGAAVAVLVLSLVACPVLAQFLPEFATTAEMLGRGGTGVAISNEAATGAINPAALPSLYRLPPLTVRAAASPVAKPVASNPGAARVVPAVYTGGRVDWAVARALAGDEPLRAVSAAWQPPSWEGDLPRLALGKERTQQVQVETRFLDINHNFLQDVGVDFDLDQHPSVTQLGYTQLNGENADFQALQLVTGRLGQPQGFGAGFIKDFDDKFMYVSAGRVIGEPAVVTQKGVEASIGAKVSFNDLDFVPSRATVDAGILLQKPLGVALEVTPTVSEDRRFIKLDLKPSVVSFGVRWVDVLNSYGDLSGAGSRVDLGAGLTGSGWRAAVDVIDAFNSNDVEGASDSGRQVNCGGELLLGKCVVLRAGKLNHDTTYGGSVRIPFLGKVPCASLTYAHTPQENQVSLLILITPTIVTQRE
jgi:hypothetical protein